VAPLVAPRNLGDEMSGFAVSGRIERVSPRLARGGADGNLATMEPDEDVIELVDVRTADPLIDRWAALIDRWAAFRERCSELTFYLFDPQSWR
jgi:hypothetical protein